MNGRSGGRGTRIPLFSCTASPGPPLRTLSAFRPGGFGAAWHCNSSSWYAGGPTWNFICVSHSDVIPSHGLSAYCTIRGRPHPHGFSNLCVLQALMNYSAYAPLAKLRAVLEEKGFCKKRDRPTILQVWMIVQNESFFVTLTPGLCDTLYPAGHQGLLHPTHHMAVPRPLVSLPA